MDFVVVLGVSVCFSLKQNANIYLVYRFSVIPSLAEVGQLLVKYLNTTECILFLKTWYFVFWRVKSRAGAVSHRS